MQLTEILLTRDLFGMGIRYPDREGEQEGSDGNTRNRDSCWFPALFLSWPSAGTQRHEHGLTILCLLILTIRAVRYD